MIGTRSRAGLLFGVAAAVGAFGVAAMTAAATAPTARADDEFLVPDIATFDPISAMGYPPLVDVVQGNERWFLTVQMPDSGTFSVYGVDTHTTFGSFTNDDFLTDYTGQSGTGIFAQNFDEVVLPDNTQIDLFDFGGGFQNEWISIPADALSGGPDAGVSDLLITPFGDFELFGTYFSDLATALG